MIHFIDNMFHESISSSSIEFMEIFKSNSYSWDGSFGKSIASRYGVVDDPLNPTWGVFGKFVTDYPHSVLMGSRVLRLQLVHGKPDISVVKYELGKRFDFIVMNEFCMIDGIDVDIHLDSFNKAVSI